MSLAHLIVRYPYVILIAVTVFSGTCLIIPLTLKKIPNFSDPQLGFETRGTLLAQRLTAWENLQEATRVSGRFVVNPKDILTIKALDAQQKQIKRKKTKKNEINVKPEVFVIAKQSNYSDEPEKVEISNWKTLQELRRADLNEKDDNDHLHKSRDGFFCGSPDQRYSRVVLSSISKLNLFTYESLLAMCHIEYQLMQLKNYNLMCETISKNHCCHPWSLVNYIALLHNRTSCLAITENDVNSTLNLLQTCSQYYHNLHLTYDCSENDYCQIPSECAEHNAVYNILHYLTDFEFLPPNSSVHTWLTESIIFLPIACSTKTLNYYQELEHKSLNYENVQVVAMEFGLKNTLFDIYLIRDTWLIGSGGLCVLLCMWLYTESVFLTFMTITAIVFSLAISYFMYTLVFELQFFPFMNLLATIVAVGIGADDAFIFCKVWHSNKAERKSSVMQMVSDTFHHAILSMFVTSLTTAAAFYTSLISSITAVRCFSVFAGTAVIANFGLMVTWLPASLVVSERWCCSPPMSPQWHAWDWEDRLRIIRQTVDHVWAFLERCLLMLALRFRYVWLFTFTAIALASMLVVLRYPGLQLPDFPEFQLFESSHPFEQYDLFYKQKFWFERLQKMDNSVSGSYKMPLRFVWGVRPLDNGDYMDPNSKGHLELDTTFNMAEPESQEWLLSFCRQLRAQPFYLSTLGPLLPNCFIEAFSAWMQRRCTDAIDHTDRSPCCERERFPYRRDVFETCIVQAMADLYETPSEYLMPGVAGPKFARNKYPPTIQAVVVEYDSNYTYSMSYAHMDRFYRQVENWTQEQLKHAPPGMRNGWFVSELEFYDLQNELSESTVLAIGIAMAVSFVVLLVVTLNILISVFAIVTISCSIFSTMAILVLLGWKLNVLESIAVSTAVGLAVDFSLHYGVNYRLCSADSDRHTATRATLSNMAGPTAMAALTTGMAGALMLPSSVLAYIQIGLFLVVMMAVSWLYATFMFGSILSIAGPERGFGQFRYPYPFQNRCPCCRERPRRRQRDLDPDTSSADTRTSRISKNVCNNVLSETTLSTTSIMCVVPSSSESHELESLTAGPDIKVTAATAKQKATKYTGQHQHQQHPNKFRSSTTAPDQSPSANSDITIIMIDDN